MIPRKIQYQQWVPKETQFWFNRLRAGTDDLNKYPAYETANIQIIERVLTDINVQTASPNVIRALTRKNLPLRHLHVFLLHAANPSSPAPTLPTHKKLIKQFATISQKAKELAALLDGLPPEISLLEATTISFTTMNRPLIAAAISKSQSGLRRGAPRRPGSRSAITSEVLRELANDIDMEQRTYTLAIQKRPRAKVAGGSTYASRNAAIDDLIVHSKQLLRGVYPVFLAEVASIVCNRAVSKSSIQERAKTLRIP